MALTSTAPTSGDDGSVPAELAALLARHAAGQAGLAEVVTGLAGHRLLVPLLQVPADDGDDPCAGQGSAMAVASRATDQGPVGLAFTGVGPLAAWDRAARPLPVPAPRVAAALVAEGGVALHVDPSGPVRVRLGRVALGRLAAAEPWPAPWADPAVRDAVVAVLAPVLASGEVAVRLAPGETGGLAVVLRFVTGVDAALAEQRAAVIAARLSADPGLLEVFDGILAVQVAAPGAPAGR